jgi:hypothetical protein
VRGQWQLVADEIEEVLGLDQEVPWHANVILEAQQ